MRRKTTPPPPKPELPHTFETFRNPAGYSLMQLRQEEPSCFNGAVAVKRYRITAEEIQEPDEVIVERIRKLWRECSNHHHWDPLQRAAAKYGVKLAHADIGKTDAPSTRA